MLATLDQLKAALGITNTDQDAMLLGCLKQANAMIANYIGADLSDTSEREYTTMVESGATHIHLPVYPVLEVLSISMDCAPIRPTEYTVSRRSRAIFFGRYRGFGWYEVPSNVRYRAGYPPEAIPADLNMVCLNLAAAIFNKGGSLASATTGGTGDLKSLTMFDAMSMSFETGGSAASDTPESIMQSWGFMLNQYRLNFPVMK